MADKVITFRKLQAIAAKRGISHRQGKGSHVVFFQDKVGSYPIPKRKEVSVPYVQGFRKRFKLRTADGVSDEEFYDD